MTDLKKMINILKELVKIRKHEKVKLNKVYHKQYLVVLRLQSIKQIMFEIESGLQ